MTIDKFMSEKLVEIKEIISTNILKDRFDSHEFIKIFSKKFEVEYVDFLKDYEKTPFKTVNAQIALWLLRNKVDLNIDNNGKTQSESIFGNDVPNELWIKNNF